MSAIPPGVGAESHYYIRAERADCPGKVLWVARFNNSHRFWNVGPGWADPFSSLAEAKKVVRSLSKRSDMVGATFSVVEVRATLTVHPAWPLEVLDKLARAV